MESKKIDIKITSKEIKDLSIEEQKELAVEIRGRILEVVSKNGGHLSPSLGAVELIIGMHAVFDIKSDPFIFDVSHQAYAHKLLTGRWESFESLRQFGGVSGFTKPCESELDYFISGHSSTSISLAVGAAKAISLNGEKRVPIALIGDGSMSAGMVYEALNELGDRKYPVVILLNDNEMSIAEPIGAISKYLSQALAGKFFQSIKHRVDKLLTHMPESATYLAKRFEESLKLITPGILFEELGIDYIGPIDGHNQKEVIETLKQAKEFGSPVIVHAQTLKGKGYEIAEGQLERWHGVGPFDVESGKILKKSSIQSPTEIFSLKLLELATINKKIVGVTAAMPSGTGLTPLIEKFPDRFWDVAIAEQHAITSMATLAKEGYKPFVAIYSTFLQRGFDSIIHDVSLMSLPVVFAIDRAGIVGEDGETHQGIFDISYLRLIPNITLLAPRDNLSLQRAIEFASNADSPVAFRYPRGSFASESFGEDTPFELGKSQMIKECKGEVLFVGYGNGVARAFEVSKRLEKNISILDLRFVKPLDEEKLKELSTKYKRWFIFSDSIKIGGVSSAILEFFVKAEIFGVEVVSFELEDEHVTHGNTTDIERYLKVDIESLTKRVIEKL